MTHTKFNATLGIAVGILFASGAMTTVHSADGVSGNLSPSEVFKKAQETYAALTSYQDEGSTISTVNGTTITNAFTIRLARPNLYRIEWKQNVTSSFSLAKTKTQAVWSAGAGDFLDMGMGTQKQTSQDLALASATGISGGAAATIPGTFFKMNWGNQLGGPIADQKPQGDRQVGEVACYVFTSESNGQTKTLWIGKQDFLIHQVQNVTSAEAMKAVLADAAKANPNLVPAPQAFSSVTSTETHTDIVVNQKFSPADFTR